MLTADRQVRRLSPADFPVPVTAIERIRIPASFSARSARHRRDLAATVQNKLAAAGHGKRRPARPGARRPARATAAEDDLEIAALRRQLREHPCHGCPDREEHARRAEGYLRLEREAEALESRVAGRTHVIARTFDRVCAVLDRARLPGRRRRSPRRAGGSAGCTPSWTCWPPSACGAGSGTGCPRPSWPRASPR